MTDAKTDVWALVARLRERKNGVTNSATPWQASVSGVASSGPSTAAARERADRMALRIAPSAAWKFIEDEAADALLSLHAEVAQLTQERDKLKAKCDGWERMMSEALNSGDGSYRP